MKKIRFKVVLLPFAYFIYLGLSLVIFFIFRDFFDILKNLEVNFAGLLNLIIMLIVASIYVLTWFLATRFVFKLSGDVFGKEKVSE